MTGSQIKIHKLNRRSKRPIDRQGNMIDGFRQAWSDTQRTLKRIVPRIGKRKSSEVRSRSIEFDATRDRRYSNSDSRFDEVVHVFNQEWLGIRSAAGVLPGHKIAYPYPGKLRSIDFLQIREHIHRWNIKKAVFHGFSGTSEKILNQLLPLDVSCYLVWHGNLSPLVWRPEVDYFESAQEACRRGRLKRASMLKAGMSAVFPNSYGPMLLNSPPKINGKRLAPAFSSKRVVALVPASPDIRKNLHSSLLGAALCPDVDDVLYYGNLKGIFPAISRCKRINYEGHDRHLSFLHDIDVTINATAMDCHPMVDLEALGCGAIGISGPLFLDALETHPYTKLSTILNPFDVIEMSKRLSFLRNMDNGELNDIANDYSRKITEISIGRYVDFLGI